MNTREALLRAARKAQNVIDHTLGRDPIPPWVYVLIRYNGATVATYRQVSAARKGYIVLLRQDANCRIVRYRWTPKVPRATSATAQDKRSKRSKKRKRRKNA